MMKFGKHVWSIIMLLWLAGCIDEPKNNESTMGQKLIQAPQPPVANTEKTYVKQTIGVDSDQSDMDPLDHFGDFFNERVTFYVEDNPETFYAGQEVIHLITTTIDGKVAKRKYILKDNIINNLIDSYGNFRFRPLSPECRSLTDSLGVLKGRALNPSLSNYRVTWQLDNRSITYTHEDRDTTSFIMTEEWHAYKQALRHVANGLAPNSISQAAP
ncbi:MAG: hypothetical protein JXQ90_15095 [Cyclobacteriaceae bacterium]